MKLPLLATCALFVTALAGSGAAAEAARAPALAPDVPAGGYQLDRAHASLIFRVDHLGFSKYTARFTRFDAALEFDPVDPAASSLVATVDARSLETDFPFAEQLDFNAQLRGEEWLDAEEHPQMTFRSTRVVLTGPSSASIDGDLTLRGVTRPMTLDATFNGGYAGHPMDPQARIGFSARGVLQRSAYGMTYGIPEPGTTMGVGDDVEVIIEAEFSGPGWQGAAQL
jgi:polyisoprenoid-binding protein YceI